MIKRFFYLLPAAMLAACNPQQPIDYSFGSTDVRYEASEMPAPAQPSWEGSGWRGEKVSAQLVLGSDVPAENVSIEFTAFRSPEGKTLDPSIAQARFVRYVLTDEFGPGCGYRKPEDFPVFSVADMLDNEQTTVIEAGGTVPVWLTFNIPANSEPGTYTGTLKLKAKDRKTTDVKLSLEVLPQTLPEPSQWKFYLDLWQHPAAVARVNNVEVWSEEHWKLLEAPMKMLANAGQKVITATVNKDPWNNQCYDAYADMITWTRKANGQWEYNYDIFDRWIQMMMKLGVDKVINCYSMLPWNNEIHYYDEAKQQQVNVSLKPGSREFNQTWTPFLVSFRQHLSEKGWLEITNIAMDERSPADMKAALKLLGEVVPEMGVALADNHKSYKEYPLLKDVCVAFGSVFEEESLKFRRANGLVSTWYVCCSDAFPNVFTFSDPAEATYIGWYTMAADFDGFLRWAYNSWVENPTVDSRFRTWPAGDTSIIYPGGRSSIRFERLIEGIQDAEKIRILREAFTANGDTDKLNTLEEALKPFNVHRKPDTPASEMLKKGKATLVELSR